MQPGQAVRVELHPEPGRGRHRDRALLEAQDPGRDGGRVRPPLSDLTDAELAERTALVDKVS